MIDEIVIIVFQYRWRMPSIYNGNPTKATTMLLLQVEVLKMVTTNDDDDHVVIWL